MAKRCLVEKHYFIVQSSVFSYNVTKLNAIDAWGNVYINKCRNLIVNLGPIQSYILL